MGAVHKNKLTFAGYCLAKMNSIDSLMGNFILHSVKYDCLRDVCSLASMIDNIGTQIINLFPQFKFSGDPFPPQFDELEKHYSDYGDHITLMNLYKNFLLLTKIGSDREAEEWCIRNLMQYSKFTEARRMSRTLYNQMTEIIEEYPDQDIFQISEEANSLTDEGKILYALRESHVTNVARKNGDEYTTIFAKKRIKAKLTNRTFYKKTDENYLIYTNLTMFGNKAQLGLLSVY